LDDGFIARIFFVACNKEEKEKNWKKKERELIN